MQNISFYFKKFENLEIFGDKAKTEIIKTIEEITGIKLTKKEVLVLKNNKIKILKIGPEKTIIFLNKQKIESRLGGKKII